MLAIPPMILNHYKAHFLPASFLLMFTCVAAMKLYSFSDVMKDMRQLKAENAEVPKSL